MPCRNTGCRWSGRAEAGHDAPLARLRGALPGLQELVRASSPARRVRDARRQAGPPPAGRTGGGGEGRGVGPRADMGDDGLAGGARNPDGSRPALGAPAVFANVTDPIGSGLVAGPQGFGPRRDRRLHERGPRRRPDQRDPPLPADAPPGRRLQYRRAQCHGQRQAAARARRADGVRTGGSAGSGGRIGPARPGGDPRRDRPTGRSAGGLRLYRVELVPAVQRRGLHRGCGRGRLAGRVGGRSPDPAGDGAAGRGQPELRRRAAGGQSGRKDPVRGSPRGRPDRRQPQGLCVSDQHRHGQAPSPRPAHVAAAQRRHRRQGPRASVKPGVHPGSEICGVLRVSSRRRASCSANLAVATGRVRPRCWPRTSGP